jgi:hypothetical protein
MSKLVVHMVMFVSAGFSKSSLTIYTPPLHTRLTYHFEAPCPTCPADAAGKDVSMDFL